MEFRRTLPHPPLRGIVRSFGERRGTLGATELSWPLAARPHQIIDIYLKEPLHFQIEGRNRQRSPEEVVLGPQVSRRTQIYALGDLQTFNILFQPAGLNRLIGIDMTSLVDKGISVRDVLGKHATILIDTVRSMPDFPSRVAAAERWIGIMLDSSAPDDGIGVASRLLVATRGGARIGRLIERSGLGARQFQRRFTTQIGLSPSCTREQSGLMQRCRRIVETRQEPGPTSLTKPGISIRRILSANVAPWCAPRQLSLSAIGKIFSEMARFWTHNILLNG